MNRGNANMIDFPIILASASPRRKELMKLAGYNFTICPSQADEDIPPDIPSRYVCSLAKLKAREVAERQKLDRFLVIGADTIVSLNNRILGKPYDYDDAYNTLNSLSDQTHQVFTGVCLILVENGVSRETSFFERTDVTFYPVSHREIVEYLATDEPFDKAGSYGIQGRGGLFVRGISGDYNNVVGLPIARLYHEINNLMQGLRD